MRLAAPLVCYVIALAVFPPAAFTVADEGLYVAQAVAFASGSRTVRTLNPLTGVETRAPVARYPVGTALIQTPFVWLGGWRAAPWASACALAFAVLVLGAWLRAMGYGPAFALLLFAYPSALVLGRVGMSDVPAASIVTLALALFWWSRQRSARAQAIAGGVMGISLLFRETNLLVWAPFALGAMFRREPGWRALAGGIAGGVAVRLAVSLWMYGNPFFLRDQGAGFAIEGALRNAAFYAAVLMTFIPLGLAAVVAYRGPRRAELTSAVAATFVLFTFYAYRATSSGLAQQLVLASRFFLPAVPLLVVACAEVYPRWFARLAARGTHLADAASVLACIAAVAVHPVVARNSEQQVMIVHAIYGATPDSAVVIENLAGAQRFLNPVYGPRTTVYRHEVPADSLPGLVARNRDVYIAFVDRPETATLREDALENAVYVQGAERVCALVLVYDQAHPGGHVRVWKIAGCDARTRRPSRRG
ncbi:MAG TPA: hypothetical protein VE967_15500 [Gemmatimonadaceae bacterium]|nr:hypothetical protein [Gemmatimonadaceae bacterium]